MSATLYALRFASAFVLLWLGVEVLRASPLEPVLLRDAFLDVAAAALGLLGEQVHAVGRTLASSDVHLRIVRGCEGAEALVLIAAAVIALPALALRMRLLLLMLALLLGWALCVLRLLLLFLTLRYQPAQWELVHGLVAPLLPVLVILLAFDFWTRSIAERRAGALEHVE